MAGEQLALRTLISNIPRQAKRLARILPEGLSEMGQWFPNPQSRQAEKKRAGVFRECTSRKILMKAILILFSLER